MKALIFFALVLGSVAAWAYIPPYWMILSRTADNHGHGVYQIEQEVAFQQGDEPLIVNERWTIESENTMRLEVTSRKQSEPFHLTYIYRDGRRHWVDENGVKKSERVPEDWFEPFLYFRLSKNLKALAVQRGMAPATSLKSEPYKYTAKKPSPDPEPYVRLSRVDGLVAYAIGTPTPASTNEMLPGIWIEQDHFLVRKVRFASQAELTAQNYKNFHDLWVPRDMQISWQGHEAKVSVTNVISLGPEAKKKSSFDPSDLNFGKNPQVASQLPNDPAIRDFYSRLR
jgi:hypothetical protein